VISIAYRFLKSNPDQKNRDKKYHPVLKDHTMQRVLLRQIL